ncbi:cellulose-binding domain-containing protein [Catenulispora pinisilvae]|uniref:cellulose-binding domain-containing protein n=1 Tax=Catenulispora pinisilvae TaxID=2705253 RepID=UPI0018915110|nr:cellulose-binding domain-containing protein [Catenulispora pinisilvae]
MRPDRPVLRGIRVVAVVAVAVTLMSSLFILGSRPAEGAGATCAVTYQPNQWSTGFTADVTVANGGPAVTAWTATWSWTGNQQVTSGWDALVSQSGQQVTATSEPYNGSVGAGATADFGFQATYSGTNSAPVGFAFNGVPCSGLGASGSSPSSPPSSSVSSSPSSPPSSQPSSGPCPVGAVFCDGFESQTSTVPTGRWSVVNPNCAGTGTAAITTSQAHSGAKSLEIDGHGTYCDHVFASDATDMASAAPTWYVRFWMRHTAPLPTDHTTFLAMNDSAHGNTDLRLGAQNGALMWNRQTDDATLPDQSPAGVAQSVVLPTGAWECLEFSVDGGTGQIHTWYNGDPVPGLTADGVPTADLDDQWLAGSGASWRPQLTDLKLGWENYSSGDDTLWFDDVVLSTSRIGC